MRSVCDNVALVIIFVACIPWTGLLVGLLMWLFKGNTWMITHRRFRLIIDDCFYAVMILVVLSLMVRMVGAFWP